MAKKKKQQMSTDVAKAVWEKYANLYRERWVKQLEKASINNSWSEVYNALSDMQKFEFDFNRSNK